MRILIAIVMLLTLAAPAGARGGPELLLQSGHTDAINALGFSPDGKLLVTGSSDDVAKIWDLETGRVHFTLTGHSMVEDGLPYASSVTSAGFSPDGRLVATGSWDRTVRLWSLSSGLEVAKLAGHEGRVRSVAWSPDGRLVASGAEDYTVRVWDVKSRKAARVIKMKEQGAALIFSRDGKWLYAADDENLRIYDAATGEGVGDLQGHAMTVNGLALTPDGTLVSCGSDGLIIAWDVKGRRPRVRIEAAVGNGVTGIALSPDGKRVAASLARSEAGVWDLASGKLVLSIPELPAMQNAVAWSPDGKSLALGGSDRVATLWSASTGKPLPSLQGTSVAIFAIAVTPDAETLVTTGRSGAARFWDLTSGRLRETASWQSQGETSAMSPDGSLVATGSYTGAVELWDVASQKRLRTIEAHPTGNRWTSEIAALVFSPDGRVLASAAGDKVVNLWDPSNGRKRGSLVGHDGSVFGIDFSPDGKAVATASSDGTVRLWDVASKTCTAVRKVPLPRGSYRRAMSVAFSPDGKLLAAGDYYGHAFVWELEYEDEPKELRGPIPRVVWDVRFSPDGRMLAVADERLVVLYDVATWKPVHTLAGHLDNVTSMAFLNEGRVLATVSLDTTTRFWDTRSGELLAMAVELNYGKDWVVTTPDGLFDGSPGGQRLLEWRVGEHVYALEQFFNDYYTPRLLTRVLMSAGGSGARGGERPRASTAIARVKPPPRVRIMAPENGARTAQNPVPVHVAVEDTGGGVSDVRLFLNGHRVTDSQRDAAKSGFSWNVQLVKGRNDLKATASNQQGDVESRGDQIRVVCDGAAARPPVLHVLAVGIDRYKAGLTLGFARADAEAISRFFRPGLFSDVKVHLLTNEGADKQSILDALAEMKKSAAPHDTLVAYFAGHGTLVGELFYFLPYDARVVSDDTLRQTGLSSVELGEALSDIPATKQIFVLDACHSGASTSALGRLVATRDAIGMIRAQQRLARSSGTFLIAASTAEQYAKEFPELGHGVLTYALLTGLGEKGTPAAARSEAGEVTVNALLRYVSEQVPLLAEKYQGGRQDVVQFSTGQDFPLVIGGK